MARWSFAATLIFCRPSQPQSAPPLAGEIAIFEMRQAGYQLFLSLLALVLQGGQKRRIRLKAGLPSHIHGDVAVANLGCQVHNPAKLASDLSSLSGGKELPKNLQAKGKSPDCHTQIMHRIGIGQFGRPVQTEGQPPQKGRSLLRSVSAHLHRGRND